MSSFCIHILNVGHGDSIILELPDNNWGIVDCFKTSTEIEPPALTFLRRREVNKLTFVCLTHPHYDHYHGMLEIIEYFTSAGREIGYFWDSGISDRRLEYYRTRFAAKEYHKSKELQLLYDSVQKRITKDRSIKYLIAGERTSCLDLGCLKINSYAPISAHVLEHFKKWGADRTTSEDENLLSVVLVITYGHANVVLGADTISWKEILSAWSEDCARVKRAPQFQLIKISHHGSQEGNHEELWKCYTEGQRSVAVISTEPKRGLPHKKTMVSTLSAKVRLYSTNFWDFSKPVSGVGVGKYVKKRSVREAVEALTVPVAAYERIAPYHGDCCVTVKDTGECSVSTECKRPPIS